MRLALLFLPAYLTGIASALPHSNPLGLVARAAQMPSDLLPRALPGNSALERRQFDFIAAAFGKLNEKVQPMQNLYDGLTDDVILAETETMYGAGSRVVKRVKTIRARVKKILTFFKVLPKDTEAAKVITKGEVDAAKKSLGSKDDPFNGLKNDLNYLNIFLGAMTPDKDGDTPIEKVIGEAVATAGDLKVVYEDTKAFLKAIEKAAGLVKKVVNAVTDVGQIAGNAASALSTRSEDGIDKFVKRGKTKPPTKPLFKSTDPVPDECEKSDEASQKICKEYYNIVLGVLSTRLITLGKIQNKLQDIKPYLKQLEDGKPVKLLALIGNVGSSGNTPGGYLKVEYDFRTAMKMVTAEYDYAVAPDGGARARFMHLKGMKNQADDAFSKMSRLGKQMAAAQYQEAWEAAGNLWAKATNTDNPEIPNPGLGLFTLLVHRKWDEIETLYKNMYGVSITIAKTFSSKRASTESQ